METWMIPLGMTIAFYGFMVWDTLDDDPMDPFQPIYLAFRIMVATILSLVAWLGWAVT